MYQLKLKCLKTPENRLKIKVYIQTVYFISILHNVNYWHLLILTPVTH